MDWVTHYAFGSHLVDWLLLTILVAITLAVRIGARRFILRLLADKRGKSKGEREYWRKHGEE
jgi:hypothetical protein